ncbi:TonB-dependent receptor [bacterium]|nr:TonB-dependent receptor [bacterium]
MLCKYKIKIILIMLFITLPLFGQSENIRITGIVISQKTGRPLKNVNLELIVSHIGTATNKYGRFIFTSIKTLDDTIRVTAIGYKTVCIPVTIRSEKIVSLSINLESAIVPLLPVTIQADRTEKADYLLYEPSARELSGRELEQIPSTVMADLYKTLQKVPGVTFTNEASTQMNVRGGNFDQNLIMLDGAAVYYPFHLLGLYSSFNLDMIRTVDFSIGGFSARFGDRLSSVIDIHTKSPEEKIVNNIDISLVGAGLTAGGKINKKTRWLLSARTSYIDMISKLVKKKLPYSFYDIFSKLEFKPAQKQTISINFFKTKDGVYLDDKQNEFLESSTDTSKTGYQRINKNNFSWYNTIISLQWDWLINEKIRSHFQTYVSSVANSFKNYYTADFPDNLDDKYLKSMQESQQYINELNEKTHSNVKNCFHDFTTKFFVKWNIKSFLKVNSGFQISRFHTNYQWNGLYDINDKFNLFFDDSGDSLLFNKFFSSSSFYSELNLDINPVFHVRQGIRLSKWGFSKKIIVEPRLNIKYDFTEKCDIKLAFGRFSQGIATALEDGLIGFLELYFPVDVGKTVETSYHYLANISYKHKMGGKISLSCYYKKFSGLLKSTGPEPSFRQTPGRAAGVEIELTGKVLGWNGWISYVLSNSKRTAGNVTYDTNFDQRHRLEICLNKKFKSGWSISSFWEFHTGQPYAAGGYQALIPGISIFRPLGEQHLDSDLFYIPYNINVPRGRIRYPNYHRLDISIKKAIKLKKCVLKPYLNIRNVYYRKNVLFYRDIEFSYDFDNGKLVNPHIERDAFVLPIIPTMGLRVSF